MLVTCNVSVYVSVCANARLAASLNEQSGFGMHRSLLLCALRQAPERKWWKGSVSLCVCVCVCVCVSVQMCYKYLEETDSENLWKLLNSFRLGKWNLENGCIIWKESKKNPKNKNASPLGMFFNRQIIVMIVSGWNHWKEIKVSQTQWSWGWDSWVFAKNRGQRWIHKLLLNFHFFLMDILVL